LPLAAVLVLHAPAADLGALAAMSAAPAVLVGLIAGPRLDRHRRRPVMIGADLGRAALLLIIPIAALAHRLVMAELYLVAALVGAASVLFDMADHAYLPSLVDRNHLVAANARLSATESTAEIGGPALAGVLVSLLTAPIAIAVNAVTYLASAAILATIGHPEAAPPRAATPPSWRADLLGGFRALFAEPLIRPLFLTSVTSALFGAFFFALYTFFAVTTLRLTPAMLGVTIAVGGVGALVGASLAAWLGRRLGIGRALILAGLLEAAFTLLIPLAGGGPARAMAMLMAGQLFGDALGTAFLIHAVSLRQAVLPGEVLGRVAGAFAAGAGLATVVGALIGGALGGAIGARDTLFISSAGLALAPLWCLASPIWRLKTAPA